MIARACLVVVFIVASIAHAQDTADSLLNVYKKHPKDTLGVQALNDLEIAYEFSDFEKARNYVKMAYNLSKEIKFERGITMSVTNFCWLYKNNRKPDSALIFQKQLLGIAKKKKN